MAAAEAEAAVLLDRLQDCGLDEGLVEEDFAGTGAREPLRSCVRGLSLQLWAVSEALALDCLPRLKDAMLTLDAAVSSHAAAQGGSLDAALSSAAQALEASPPCSPPLPRRRSLWTLVTALQSGSMALSTRRQSGAASSSTAMDVGPGAPSAGSSSSRALRSLAESLEVSAGGSSAVAVAEAVRRRAESLVSRLPACMGRPTVDETRLSDSQRAALAVIAAELEADYAQRRRMLVERAGVCVMALAGAAKLGSDAEASAAVQKLGRERLAGLNAASDVCLEAVWSTPLAEVLAPLGSAGERTGGAERGPGEMGGSWVKEVRIGDVPGRGGRADGKGAGGDMPAWKERVAGSNRGGRGRGGGGRGGGGKGTSRGRKIGA